MIGIYKITNPTGKVYIGQSWDLIARKSFYKRLKCYHQPALYRSLLKYGWDNHRFEVVHELPKDVAQSTLNEYEILYWQQYKDCSVELLNTKYPGSNGKHADETKQKISAKRIGKSSWNKGIAMTLEHKARIASALVGKNVGKNLGATNLSARKVRQKSSGECYDTVRDAAKAHNCSSGTIIYRINKGLFEYL